MYKDVSHSNLSADRKKSHSVKLCEVDMNFVALKMLTGDRAKYVGLIFTIAFASFLIAHQASIFAGVMDRTRGQVKDAIWGK